MKRHNIDSDVTLKHIHTGINLIKGSHGGSRLFGVLEGHYGKPDPYLKKLETPLIESLGFRHAFTPAQQIVQETQERQPQNGPLIRKPNPSQQPLQQPRELSQPLPDSTLKQSGGNYHEQSGGGEQTGGLFGIDIPNPLESLKTPNPFKYISNKIGLTKITNAVGSALNIPHIDTTSPFAAPAVAISGVTGALQAGFHAIGSDTVNNLVDPTIGGIKGISDQVVGGTNPVVATFVSEENQGKFHSGSLSDKGHAAIGTIEDLYTGITSIPSVLASGTNKYQQDHYGRQHFSLFEIYLKGFGVFKPIEPGIIGSDTRAGINLDDPFNPIKPDGSNVPYKPFNSLDVRKLPEDGINPFDAPNEPLVKPIEDPIVKPIKDPFKIPQPDEYGDYIEEKLDNEDTMPPYVQPEQIEPIETEPEPFKPKPSIYDSIPDVPEFTGRCYTICRTY